MIARNEVAVSEVRRLFNLDPEKGILTRRFSRKCPHRFGDVVGSAGQDGYLRVRVAGRFFYVHRLIWAHAYGAWPAEIDHIDRDKANNRLSNLRECTRSQNQHNRRAFKTSKTGIKGVFPVNGRFRATMRLGGKQIYIGQFKTLAEAAEARSRAEQLSVA